MCCKLMAKRLMACISSAAGWPITCRKLEVLLVKLQAAAKSSAEAIVVAGKVAPLMVSIAVGSFSLSQAIVALVQWFVFAGV